MVSILILSAPILTISYVGNFGESSWLHSVVLTERRSVMRVPPEADAVTNLVAEMFNGGFNLRLTANGQKLRQKSDTGHFTFIVCFNKLICCHIYLHLI